MTAVAASALHGTGHAVYAGAFDAQTITVASAVTGAVARAPRVSQSDVVVPDLVARLVRRNAPTTSVATLDDAYDKRWLDQLNDAGSGGLKLDADDADLALFGDGDLIRFELFGEAAITILAREFVQTTVGSGEEHDEATEITGPGHLAILEEAVVYPSRGTEAAPVEDDRVFNWSAVAYDDSEWGYASAVVRQDMSADSWLVDGYHAPNSGENTDQWPDPSAYWIWAPGYTEEWAPDGSCYFRTTFTQPATAQAIAIYMSADAVGELYIDGQKVIDSGPTMVSPATVSFEKVSCTPGVHTIAAHVENNVDWEFNYDTNPGGLLATVYSTDTQGNFDPSSPVVRTDSSWKIVSYPPSPPGMTAGEVIRVCIEEAQARGTLLDVTMMFDDEVDSDGAPWPEVTDIATKVGTDYLTFFKEIADSYCDIWMAPSGVELWAWLRDERGETQSVTLTEPTDTTDPATGNLASLVHRKVI